MKRTLTFLEATSVVVGAGVGGGVMAVPYLAARTGLVAFFPIILIAFLLNVLLNLMLTEVLLRDGRDLQIVELMRAYVFRNRFGAALAWVFFGVLGLSFVASLTAYITGAGDVLAGLTGMETGWARLAVYLVSAAIVFFGLKSVGFSEKLALGVIVAFVLIVGVGSIRSWRADGLLLRSGSGNWREVLGLYGIVMYSLNAAFAVPQAVQGLGRDAKRCVAAVVTGAAINALLVAAVTVVAIMVSRPVTEVAVVGIGDATNRAVAIAGALFVVSAMLTTYWSVSLALSDIINQRLKLGARISWLIATAPTLVLLLAGLFGFVEYMQIAGGIVALAVAYITVPMYLRARREGRVGAPGWSLGKLGTWPVLLLFVAAMVAMAAGSLLGLL